MSNKFGEINYYSERGMVNAICYSMYQYKSAAFHFIKKINDVNGNPMFKEELLNNIESIKVFNEFSFGEFGDPDLILKINYKNKNVDSKLLFIEAKVGTYDNSAKKDCFTETYENNASRINYQLRLKKRFVDAYKNIDSNAKEIIEVENEDTKNDKCRRLKKEYLVDYIKNTIFHNVNNDIYYISMTNDSSNPFKGKKNLPFKETENEYKNLGYITYNSFYGKDEYKSSNKSREECVLYGETYEMFKTAYDLTTNVKIKLAEENGEI